jgi:hypothetical protein
MGLSERVLLYCERGRSEALFAEPFKAASNAAFLLAALVALLLLRRPKKMRSADHFPAHRSCLRDRDRQPRLPSLGRPRVVACRRHSHRPFHARLSRLCPEPLPRRASGLDCAHFDRLCRNRVPHHEAQMLGRRHRLPRFRGNRRVRVPERQPRCLPWRSSEDCSPSGSIRLPPSLSGRPRSSPSRRRSALSTLRSATPTRSKGARSAPISLGIC